MRDAPTQLVLSIYRDIFEPSGSAHGECVVMDYLRFEKLNTWFTRSCDNREKNMWFICEGSYFKEKQSETNGKVKH